MSQKSGTFAASKRSGMGKSSQQKQPSRGDSHDKMAHMDRSLFWGDICVMWNYTCGFPIYVTNLLGKRK